MRAEEFLKVRYKMEEDLAKALAKRLEGKDEKEWDYHCIKGLLKAFGKDEAWEYIWWRCEETVRKAIGFYFKGRKDLKKVDREDVYCEIRLEIYKSIEKFGGRGSFDSFIWRISERVIKKYLKCVKEKQKEKLCRDMSEYNAREEREERIKEVMIGIALLPRIYGEVLLKYKEGYSLEDISHLTGCPLGTIRWRYVEGLRKLRKILKGE